MSKYTTKILSHQFEDNRCEEMPHACWFLGRAKVFDADSYIEFEFQIDAISNKLNPYARTCDGYEWEAEFHLDRGYKTSFGEDEVSDNNYMDLDDMVSDLIYTKSDFEEVCMELADTVDID